ncbi:MAG: DUF1840 domain-containing protein [Legionellales bacterium]|nr:DUF1840 domain-containing protein [Legionellales bacterium]
MLVTFTSKASGDITLFGKDALTLLKMMGQSEVIPSAILAKQVPAALILLTEALVLEKKKSSLLIPKLTDEDDDEVSIHQRAVPLMALLQHASDKACDVMWHEGI